MTQAHAQAANLDLNLLRVLDALLSCKGVTRTAAQLGMTQSGVSRALQRLRAHFEDPLLLRDGRQMVLTTTAERLRGPVAQILDDTRQLFLSGRGFDPARATWSASVATATYAEHWLLPPLVERLRTEAPGVDLRVVGTLGADPSDLEQGRVDLAIEPAGALDGPDLMSRKLMSDSFRCIVRRGHPFATAPTLSRFLELEHILVAPSGGAGGIVDERLAAQGMRRRVRTQVTSFVSPMHLIVASDMVVTLPRLVAEDLARRWPIEVVGAPLELGSIAVHTYWSSRRNSDPAHQWLRRVVQDSADALAYGGEDVEGERDSSFNL